MNNVPIYVSEMKEETDALDSYKYKFRETNDRRCHNSDCLCDVYPDERNNYTLINKQIEGFRSEEDTLLYDTYKYETRVSYNQNDQTRGYQWSSQTNALSSQTVSNEHDGVMCIKEETNDGGFGDLSGRGNLLCLNEKDDHDEANGFKANVGVPVPRRDQNSLIKYDATINDTIDTCKLGGKDYDGTFCNAKSENNLGSNNCDFGTSERKSLYEQTYAVQVKYEPTLHEQSKRYDYDVNEFDGQCFVNPLIDNSCNSNSFENIRKTPGHHHNQSAKVKEESNTIETNEYIENNVIAESTSNRQCNQIITNSNSNNSILHSNACHKDCISCTNGVTCNCVTRKRKTTEEEHYYAIKIPRCNHTRQKSFECDASSFHTAGNADMQLQSRIHSEGTSFKCSLSDLVIRTLIVLTVI